MIGRTTHQTASAHGESAILRSVRFADSRTPLRMTAGFEGSAPARASPHFAIRCALLTGPRPSSPLVPKRQLGTALVSEALLRRRGSTENAPSKASPRKQSFQDKRVTKPELAHETRRAGTDGRLFTAEIKALRFLRAGGKA